MEKEHISYRTIFTETEKTEGLISLYKQFKRDDDVLMDLFGSLSFKNEIRDSFSFTKNVLLYKDETQRNERETGFQIFDLTGLESILTHDDLPPQDVYIQVQRQLLEFGHIPPVEKVLLHAAIPSDITFLIPHTQIIAFSVLADWKDRLLHLFDGDVLGQSYETLSLTYLKKLRTAVEYSTVKAIVLQGYGILVFGDNLQEVQDYAICIIGRIKRLFPVLNAETGIPDKSPEEKAHSVSDIVDLRSGLSKKIGNPLLLRTYNSKSMDNDWRKVWKQGSLTAGQAMLSCSDPSEFGLLGNIFNDETLGPLTLAPSPKSLSQAHKTYMQARRIYRLAQGVGELKFIANAPSPTGWEKEYGKGEKQDLPFQGEVVLITGAASGIGKGCVEAFIEKGATVVGLDIKKTIGNISSSPAFLGVECDLTNEEAVIKAVGQAVRSFGGIDMLVLNAGIFPDSQNVSNMDITLWRKVHDINLDANVVLLRETYPLLKNAPRHGRVVFNGSRNVPAPGPGVSAYSSSKAALTQLARVAALEWGQDGINVNIVHPHAVFDTGIWSPEILQARAEKYGISIQEYKTNNVLGVELSSREVGDLIANLCSPVFSKITGAQIPVDGGSDRVI